MILGHHHNHRSNSSMPGPVKQSPGMLSLRPIRLDRFRHGGYKIEFHGAVPHGCSVRLLLGSSALYSMDITGGYKKRTSSHFEDLLKLMDQGGFWGKKVPVRVAVYSGGRMFQETLSTPQFIQCPLEPIRELGVEEIGAVEGLRYTGNPDGSGGGTFLSHPINGKYYFIYNRLLEVDSKRRGFDCTTYVGSALGMADGRGQGGTGEIIANELKAEPCDMEHKNAQAVEKFFGEHKSGSYIMWSHGHVVVVKDCVVHEFTDRVSMEKGYCVTEISEWLGLKESSDSKLKKHKDQRFSIRKLVS